MNDGEFKLILQWFTISTIEKRGFGRSLIDLIPQKYWEIDWYNNDIYVDWSVIDEFR